MNLKELFNNDLLEDEVLSKYFVEKVESERTILIDSSNKEVTREDIINFLKETGTPVTQENYDYAKSLIEKKRMNGESDSGLSLTKKELKLESMLGEYSSDEINNVINYSILKRLEALESMMKQLTVQKKYIYEIAKVTDISGCADLKGIQEVINKYSEKGFRIKAIFTDEIGVNRLSTVSVGMNSTKDQVIIIFEKEIIVESNEN